MQGLPLSCKEPNVSAQFLRPSPDLHHTANRTNPHRLVNVLEFGFDLDIFLPPACFGDYKRFCCAATCSPSTCLACLTSALTVHRRLLVGSLWPIMLLSMISIGCICLSLASRVRKSRQDSFVRLSSRVRAAVHAGLQRALPVVLVVTFVLVPSTSTLIFKTFLCFSIEYDPSLGDTSYLQDDVALRCDTDAYSATYDTALLLVLLWPVGIPVLYSLLLFAIRRAFRTGRATQLSRATTFLSGDYRRRLYWWEPVEMCRKLTLTGKRDEAKSNPEARNAASTCPGLIFN